MGHFVSVMPKFPARVVAGTGIEIVKSGATYTFSNTLELPPEIIDLPAAELPLDGTEVLAIHQEGEARQISQFEFVSAKPVLDKGTASSGTVTFDVSEAAVQKLTVAGPVTLAFTGWPTAGNYAEVELKLTNGSTNITWPGAIKWLVGDGTNSNTFADMGVTLSAAGVNWAIIWSDDGVILYGKAG